MSDMKQVTGWRFADENLRDGRPLPKRGETTLLLPTPKLCCCGHIIATVVMLPDGEKLWKCPRCGGIGGDRKELLKFLREQQNAESGGRT